jgi:hypothetical protein
MGLMATGLFLNASLCLAETQNHPYAAISRVNAFGLRTVLPGPPQVPPAVEPTPPIDVRLTGVCTLLGPPIAFFEFMDPRTKKTARPAFFRAGDVYGDGFTVVDIDAQSRSVRVIQNGVETVLDFERNGIKEGTFASATPVPSAPRPLAPKLPPSLPPGLTPEQAAARIAELREFYRQQNHPAANLLPPANPGRSIAQPSPIPLR